MLMNNITKYIIGMVNENTENQIVSFKYLKENKYKDLIT